MIACRSTRLGWLVLAMFATGAGDAFGQWSQFRGPNGSGVDSAVGYPVAFSPTSNVVWKAAVPYGQSSPVVAGRHLYLTASEGDRRRDDLSGRRHRTRAMAERDHSGRGGRTPFTPTTRRHPRLRQTKTAWSCSLRISASPPTRPKARIVGRFHWARSRVSTEWPVPRFLPATLVVLLCDQRSGSFLIALDRKTGVVRWKRARPHAVEGWSTPMVFRPSTGGAGHRTRRPWLDAARGLCPRDRRAAVVDAVGIERVDGYAGGQRRHALRIDTRIDRTISAGFRQLSPEARHEQRPSALGTRVQCRQGDGRALRLDRRGRRRLHHRERMEHDAKSRPRRLRHHRRPSGGRPRETGPRRRPLALPEEPAIHTRSADVPGCPVPGEDRRDHHFR